MVFPSFCRASEAVVPVVAPHALHHLAHVLAPERVRAREAEHVRIGVDLSHAVLTKTRIGL